jgi:wyosine [tRNA(Phe)-imidazoG37] synthetase (radical SAM superfamily)
VSFSALQKAYSDHSRVWELNRWVYPVISRRAGGLSIGINLNLDKSCSFRCAYCQVDRNIPGKSLALDLNLLEQEILSLIEEYKKNGLTGFSNFKEIAEEKRLIRDICLSGDGESTLVPEFKEVCQLMLKIQKQFTEYPLQLTLITNATHLQFPKVREGLSLLTSFWGEIWGKLDAGTDAWFRQINGSSMSLETIQNNLEMTVKDFPMQIQTMLCKIGDNFPSQVEIDAYLKRLEKIYYAGKENFKGVQLYGVVRQTALDTVSALPKDFLENVAEQIRNSLPVCVNVF